MPRKAREKSKSGIYHIMLRGINRQEIFHDDEDRIRFLETLERYKKQCKIKVHGWCLMGNHVHLIIEEGAENISNTIKRVGVSFVYYYNWKYKHIGHLFQDRYRSEEIEADNYLLTVIRYIHQNPVKAGIINKPGDWQWSSCSAYYGKEEYPVGITDKELILSMFSEEEKTAVKKFIEYNEQENKDMCLDEVDNRRMTDEEARTEIRKMIGEVNIAEIQRLSKTERDEIIRKVKGIEGISQRQAARILDISTNLLFKA